MDSPLALLHLPAGGVINCFGPESLVGQATLLASANFQNDLAWPAANRAIYLPFSVPRPVIITKILWGNGSSISGHVDVGIYNASGARLVNIGSSLSQTGTNAVQVADITDTPLDPGSYFMAMALDSAGKLFAANTPALLLQACGVQQEASAFALPANATFANPASAYAPRLSLALRATV